MEELIEYFISYGALGIITAYFYVMIIKIEKLTDNLCQN